MWPKRETNDFSGQVIIITGGSRGIGFATAQAFLEKGARVGICARNPERLAAAQRQLSQAGEVEADVVDMRDPDQIQRFVEQMQKRFGRIDVLVNNAGLAYSGAFINQSFGSIADIIDVNVKGVLYMTRAVLPLLLEQQEGTIINVSSGAGLTGFAELVSYCASKFGVVGFTESLDQEVRGQGVRVFGICPGRVATDMQEEVSGQRIGMAPEKIADKILQLAGQHPPVGTGKCLTMAS
jgi:3-oxoacyl-[acyl-carrier protein] reductase